MIFFLGLGEIIGIINLVMLIIILIIILIYKTKNSSSVKGIKDVSVDLSESENRILNGVERQNRTLIENIDKELIKLHSSLDALNEKNYKFQNEMLESLSKKFIEINNLISINNEKSTAEIKERLNDFSKSISESMKTINDSVKENLHNIQKDNNDKLERIQGVVDEKLQKTLDERLSSSFKNVIEQISGVNQAIGEIKGIASDVGSLKTVLTNVKTKGIVGEVILGNLIKNVLTPAQYEENCITKHNSKDPVEFAIKMPGSNNQDYVMLPVDSKFPTTPYQDLLGAYDVGDRTLIDNAKKELKARIKSFAKDIAGKYIDVPNTTNFAIMFLPNEGLYAEVVNMGLVEELYDLKISVAGPTTFAALLNALQMGFKTLIIQKKSADVFKLLSAVKTEFSKFAEALDDAKRNVDKAGDKINSLMETRTKAIQRKLNNFETLPEDEVKEVFKVEEDKEKVEL